MYMCVCVCVFVGVCLYTHKYYVWDVCVTSTHCYMVYVCDSIHIFDHAQPHTYTHTPHTAGIISGVVGGVLVVVVAVGLVFVCVGVHRRKMKRMSRNQTLSKG